MPELKAIENRVIVKIDTQSKNSHKFSDGTIIRLERGWNNLIKTETEPVNAVVIDGSYIPKDSLILIHHNASHDTYRIFNYKNTSGEDIANSVKYYSIPEEQCYAWHDGVEWKPMKNFAFGLRVFIPYEGKLQWVAPKLIKDVLYITSGYLKRKACHTLRASDYTIIFQGINGQEERIVRCRHSEQSGYDREEIVGVNKFITEMINEGKYLIGLTP